MIFLSTLLLSIFITIALVPICSRLAVKYQVMDFPDKRKVHPQPMPRSGGIAMALGFFVCVVFFSPLTVLVKAILIGAGIVVLFGFIDDLRNLGFKAKFSAQLVAALVVVLYGGVKITSLGALLPDNTLIPDWFAIPLTLIIIVGITNAINLSDGLDGLAGGICLMSFGCLGFLAFQCENIPIFLLSTTVVGVIFGFLRFNTYPATLFMGDAGSQLLGFLLATLSLGLTQGNIPISPLVPLFLWGFPVIDTLAVIVKRLFDGRHVFRADKNHFHHNLIRMGLFHTEAVFFIYIIQAIFITWAYFLRFYSEWPLLVVYLTFSTIVLISFFIADRFHWKFRRYDLVDKFIKGRLKILKEKNILIKVSFRTISAWVPGILFFSCFLPEGVPEYFLYITVALAGIVLATWFAKKEWMGGALRLAIYLFAPIVIYLGEANSATWVNPKFFQLYNFSFAILAIFVILTVKFTRRTKGFKTNPMDFLILLIALVVPNLPDPHIRSYHLGLIATKIIVLFFSYEVLIGELRGRLKGLTMATLAAMVVIGMKGVL